MKKKLLGLTLLLLCLFLCGAAQAGSLYISSETAVDLSLLDNGYAYIVGTDAGGAGTPYYKLPQTGWTWAVRRDSTDIYTLVLSGAELTGYASLSADEKCGVLFQDMLLCVELNGSSLISTTGGQSNTAGTIVGIRGVDGGLVFVGDGSLEVRATATGSATQTVGLRVTGTDGDDEGCVRVSGEALVDVWAGQAQTCIGLDLSRDLIADGGTLRADVYNPDSTERQPMMQMGTYLGMQGRSIRMVGGGVQLSGSTRAARLSGSFRFDSAYPDIYYYFRNLSSAERPEHYHVSGYAKFVYNQSLKYLRVQETEPVPETGDASHPLQWAALMALSLAAMAAMTLLAKRQKG